MHQSFFRGRRLRSSATLREMIREHEILPQHLIMPYFVVETDEVGFRKPIQSMPGVFQLSLDELEKEVREAVELGLRSLILFGIPRQKDPEGSQAWAENGIIQQAVHRIKGAFPDLIVITDVCLCEYTSHGHCGIVSDGCILNDPTRELIARTAVSHARAGADIVAPSDMMDGRIQAIRSALDSAGFSNTPIMSYAVKFASAYYGPFREAAEGAPKFGDRKTYQMDYANRRESFREAEADILEGADMLIVKPGLPYLDIIRDLRERYNVPLAAYQVSGEFSQIRSAAMHGWLQEESTVMESLIAFRRAGADLIITYFAVDFLRAHHTGTWPAHY